MIKNKAVNRGSVKQKSQSIKKIILTLISLFTVYLITSLAFSVLIFTVELPQNSLYYIVIIGMILSFFSGGFISGKIHKKNGLINGILFNLPFMLLFVIISLTLNSLEFDYKAVITVLSVLLSSAVGGIFSVNSQKKKR